MDSNVSCFTMMATGQLESAQVTTLPPFTDRPGIDLVALCLQVPGGATAYCKFHILHGEDWTKLDGMGEGLTQIARRSRGRRLR